MEFKENNICWLTGEKSISCDFSNRKFVNKIKKLHEKHPEDFECYIENSDGDIHVIMPLSYLKISAPRQISDEQKIAASERFKKMHEQKRTI